MIKSIDGTLRTYLNSRELKEFWENVRRHRCAKLKIEEMPYSSFHDLVLHAFTWDTTPQGHHYWESISRRKAR